MKNIFGQELPEMVEKCYRYAFAPDGGAHEAILLSQSVGVELELRQTIKRDEQAYGLIRNYFFFGKKLRVYTIDIEEIFKQKIDTGYYHLSIFPVFYASDFSNKKLYSKISDSDFSDIVDFLEKRKASPYPDATQNVNSFILSYKIPYGAACHMKEYASRFVSPKVIQNIKNRIDSALVRKSKLPKIDWGMVKLNITI